MDQNITRDKECLYITVQMLIYSEDIKPARNYTHRNEDSAHENKAVKLKEK